MIGTAGNYEPKSPFAPRKLESFEITLFLMLGIFRSFGVVSSFRVMFYPVVNDL
jgi:hypothetical protein